MGRHEVKKISRDAVFRKYVFDEMSRSINRKYRKSESKDELDGELEELEHYVDSLSSHKAKDICRRLSHSRKNPVYSFIRRGPDYFFIDDVKVSKIFMIGINHRVNQYLREHCWSLKENSKDKRIIKHKEFKKRGDIHPRSMSLIAHKIDESRYKLIDGNHRAVKMASNGHKRIELIYY